MVKEEPKLIQNFNNPGLRYCLTSRDLVPYITISEYLQLLFPFINPAQVESFFGFTTDFSPLYGGRQFIRKHTLAKHHLLEMEELGINLSLNLTNHYFTEEAYQESLPLLDKHHKAGNSIICLNNKLAKRLRKDFPLYKLKASIIKNLNTLKKVQRAQELYDYVVIPMDKNDDHKFLSSLPQKEKIVLFANAACRYYCPRSSCYLRFSQGIQGRPKTSDCSRKAISREHLGRVIFDVQKFYEMGFREMKLVSYNSRKITKVLIFKFQDFKTWNFYKRAKEENKLFIFASYPKSGRTWCRYFLAVYVTLQKELDLKVDLESMFTLFPNDNNSHIKGRMSFNTIFRQDIPLVEFCHKPSSRIKNAKKSLLLIRSIPDTLVSEFFHFNNHQQKNCDDIESYIFSKKKRGVYRLCKYLNGWATEAAKSNFLSLSFEEVHSDPQKTFAKMLRFFDVEIDKTILQEAIRLSSFKEMAKKEEKKHIPGSDYDYDDIEARRVRKGKVGGYREYLSDATIQQLRDVCEDELSKAAKDLFAKHDLWPF